MPRLLLLLIPIILAIYALIDCARTPSSEMPGRIPKAFWILIILLFTLIGPIAWIITSRVHRAEAEGGLQPTLWSSGENSVLHREAPVASAPDNDPEFLREIDRQMREKKRKEYLEKYRESTADSLPGSAGENRQQNSAGTGPAAGGGAGTGADGQDHTGAGVGTTAGTGVDGADSARGEDRAADSAADSAADKREFGDESGSESGGDSGGESGSGPEAKPTSGN